MKLYSLWTQKIINDKLCNISNSIFYEISNLNIGDFCMYKINGYICPSGSTDFESDVYNIDEEKFKAFIVGCKTGDIQVVSDILNSNKEYIELTHEV